jgi:uncharacterized protein (TIGR00725 family)
MKKIIGIMGPGKARPKEVALAYQIGKLVAKTGSVLLSGGMGGVMEASCRGAHEEGGLVLAICPTYDKKDLNKFVDIAVTTGMRGARNYMNILSSDVVIAVGYDSAGTLSEIAFALQLNKPLIVIGASSKMKTYLKQFKSKYLEFVDSVKEIEKLVL